MGLRLTYIIYITQNKRCNEKHVYTWLHNSIIPLLNTAYKTIVLKHISFSSFTLMHTLMIKQLIITQIDNANALLSYREKPIVKMFSLYEDLDILFKVSKLT